MIVEGDVGGVGGRVSAEIMAIQLLMDGGTDTTGNAWWITPNGLHAHECSKVVVLQLCHLCNVVCLWVTDYRAITSIY